MDSKKINIYRGFASLLLAFLMAFVFAVNANAKDIEVTILHINDSHSHIEPTSIDLQLAGEKTRTALGGFSRMVSYIQERHDSVTNPILINSGDSITGTLYYTLFQGEPEAKLLNLLPWDATILGNHEFDGGDKGLLKFLNFLDSPVVSANVVPKKGNILEGKWQPYRIIERDGEKIGIIGIDIMRKTRDSSNPSDEIRFFDEIRTAQRYANKLTRQGINKIIVASHYDYPNEVILAQKTRNIDIIIGGDSHTLLGGEDISRTGLEPEGAYPTAVQSRSGDTVLVVQSWAYTKVLGELRVRFDEKGKIKDYDGVPHLLLNDTFRRKNAAGERVELTGASRDAVYKDIENNKNLVVVQPEKKSQKIVEQYTEAKAIVDEYKAQADQLQQKKIGVATEEIPGGSAVRIPSPEHPQGHFTAAVTAQAFLEELQSMGKGAVDAVIQNAGGVRTPIVKGDITYNTAYTLLPFANTLYILKITGADIKNTLEDAIDYALLPDGSDGAFPYTAGMKYSVDLSAGKRKGMRVSDIQVASGEKWVPLNMKKTYTIGVNSYIAGGKDGYVTLGKVSKKPGAGEDTYLDYANSFVNYALKHKNISKPESTNVAVKF